MSMLFLDPDGAWEVVKASAEASLACDATHSSPTHGRDYRVVDVQNTKGTIERTRRDEVKQRKPLTRNAVVKMINILNDFPSGCPKEKVHETHYFTNMLMELHPQVRLRNGLMIVVAAE